MSAHRPRARLAAIGEDLVAARGGPGARRGAALLNRLAGRSETVAAFVELEAAPEWIRLPRPALERLADHAALAALAPRLARTVDGRLLGAIARSVGADAVDWAIGVAGEVEAAVAMPGDADRVRPLGFAMMRKALPAPLRPLLDWAPADAAPDIAPDPARACVELAFAGCRE